MRSAKSVKRNHITKHAYKNKSHKKKSAKKAMFYCKEWKKTTYSSEKYGIVIDFAAVAKHNTFYNVSQQKTEVNKETPKIQNKDEYVKQQKNKPNEKINEQTKQKVKENKKSEQKIKVKSESKVETKVVKNETEKKLNEKVDNGNKVSEPEKVVNEVKKDVVENPLTVDVSSKIDVAEMKASVDSGIDFNNANHSTGSTSPQAEKSGSPFRTAASGNSFFESVSKIVQTALGTAENKPISKLQINHSGGGRQRSHKLNPRDIKFCIKMIEKFEDDFEAMSKSEDNVYMDTPSGIKRKVRLFKESPFYEQWQNAKKEGKSMEDILAC